MAKSALPGVARAARRLARHARAEVVELRDEQGRRRRRGRRALRRPRHRQALGVRARARRSSISTSTRRRSPRSATPTSRSSARSSPCSRSSRSELRRRRPSPGAHRGVAPADRRAGARSSRCATRRAAPMLKPQRVLERLQALTAGRDDVDLDDRRRPAPDVGDAVPAAATSRARSSPRAGSARWATASRRPSARRRRGPTRRSICVDGDGCFQMTSQELATAALEELPIVVVIVNNGYLGMVRQWQDMFFEERFSQIAPDAQRCPTTRRSRVRTARSASPPRTTRSSRRR